MQLWHDIGRIADSPPVDGDAAPATDTPRFVPITLAPRSSDPEESRPKLGRIAAAVGALSLVPAIGTPFAVAAVFWGLTTKKRGGNRLVWLGLAGIGLSIAALVVFLVFKSYRLPFGPLEGMLAQQHLGAAVQAVEFHKLQTGRYPSALTDLRDTQPGGRRFSIIDPINATSVAERRFFYYEAVDADHYYLRSVGADGEPFTADDVVPEIDIKPGSRVGLLTKR